MCFYLLFQFSQETRSISPYELFLFHMNLFMPSGYFVKKNKIVKDCLVEEFKDHITLS